MHVFIKISELHVITLEEKQVRNTENVFAGEH